MAWLRRKPPASPPTRFWTDADERAAEQEITQLIADFLAGPRISPWFIDSAHYSVDLGQEYTPEVFGMGLNVEGWIHIVPHRYAVAVGVDGTWTFQGYHTYWAEGAKHLSGWYATMGAPGGNTSWFAMGVYEVTNVADPGTASPQAVVNALHDAMRIWKQ